MRVLKIIGKIDININVPEDAVITTVSINDYLNTQYEEKFDFIFCVYVLQSLWTNKVGSAISKLVNDLAHMGELHIYVPAAEQAAKALIKGGDDPITFYQLWGTKEFPTHTGFTLVWLRALVVQAGALVRRANLSQFKLSYEDKEVTALGHFLLATIVRDR